MEPDRGELLGGPDPWIGGSDWWNSGGPFRGWPWSALYSGKKSVLVPGGLAQVGSVPQYLFVLFQTHTETHCQHLCISGATSLLGNGPAHKISPSCLIIPCSLRWQTWRGGLWRWNNLEGAWVSKSFLGVFCDLPWMCESERWPCCFKPLRCWIFCFGN